MITLVFMRDCHAAHNQTITVAPDKVELYRRLATKRGWLMGIRKGGAA